MRADTVPSDAAEMIWCCSKTGGADMKTIQISHDLRQPDHLYTALEDYIHSYERRSQPLSSMWLVKTNKTVAEVRDELLRVVDEDDDVLVFDVTGAAWASNLSDAATQRRYGRSAA
jgi:cobalamin-dependent methionine synthase I